MRLNSPVYFHLEEQSDFESYLSYNAPHSPFQVPDSLFDNYKSKVPDDERDPVYGLCDNMDNNIGRLLEVLDELNLKENTIIIFLSENGPNNYRFNGNMKWIKGSVYEGGMRVPCLVSWPGRIGAHSLVKQIAAHINLFPTLFELYRLKNRPEAHTGGMSLVKILPGKSVPVANRVFYDHIAFSEPVLFPHPGTIWSNQYRLVVNRDSFELYDLLDDPSQLSYSFARPGTEKRSL